MGEHSINGNLKNNQHPKIKIVDLGNALSYNRHINTFEVQSLYYRAPEVFFGHSMSSAIDLWSVGCILFELTKLTKFKAPKTSSMASSSSKSSKKRKKKSGENRHHHALFACRNQVELARKIHSTLSSFPAYVYNEWTSCYLKQIRQSLVRNEYTPSTTTSSYGEKGHGHDIKRINGEFEHCEMCYVDLKDARIERLIKTMNVGEDDLAIDSETCEFLDLISGLLDLNPSTRLTSEDAIQHSFCINLKYIRSDEEVLKCLEHFFESAYPQISISSDEQRQSRINLQMEQFKMFELAQAAQSNSLPVPKEMAVTQKRAPYAYCDGKVSHNKVHCLFHGCCGNPTVKIKKEMLSGTPPLKKMRLSSDG